MKKKIETKILVRLFLILTMGCQNKPKQKEQQYKKKQKKD